MADERRTLAASRSLHPLERPLPRESRVLAHPFRLIKVTPLVRDHSAQRVDDPEPEHRRDR